MFKPIAVVLSLMAGLLHAPAPSRAAVSTAESLPVYELRIYEANPDRLAALQTVLRQAGPQAYRKQGAELVFSGTVLEGARSDGDKAPRMLVEVLAHKSQATAAKAWAAIEADRAWKSAWAAAEKTGPLLAVPTSSTTMLTTDFSPALATPTKAGEPQRVFELRKYNTGPASLENTLRQFRTGMAKIIADTGMTPVIYWTAADNSAFIYLLADKDREAARASWAAFITPYRAFIADYNAKYPPPAGPRTPDDNRFLTPTDYSPRR